MSLSEEALKLEKLRQQIESAEYDSGSSSDYIDRGNPNESQKKQAEELIRKKNAESTELKRQLHELIQNSPRQAIEEWTDFHIAILQTILLERKIDSHAKTRKFVAQQTLEEWQSVRNGSKEYVNINWHFLKDYKERVRKSAKGSWWKIW